MVWYRDINMELLISQDGDFLDDEDVNAIVNSITNIVKTLQNSRRMLPTFAFNAHFLLFEPLSEDVANALANNIWDSIEQWEPRVKVEGINVTIDWDNSKYDVTLRYSIINITKEIEELTVILNKL